MLALLAALLPAAFYAGYRRGTLAGAWSMAQHAVDLQNKVARLEGYITPIQDCYDFVVRQEVPTARQEWYRRLPHMKRPAVTQ